ncbi:MAG: hypothetical protein GY940_22100 [bacterium]|nr:hypothetical protein [bacterium]
MKTKWILILITIVMVIMAGLSSGCSSSKETATENENKESKAGDKNTPGNTAENPAADYYTQLGETVSDMLNHLDQLNNVIRSQNKEQMAVKLKELQESIKTNADKAKALGAYKGDSEYGTAVLDYLEFYESLYRDDYPAALERLIEGDQKGAQGLILKVQVRVRSELPGFENAMFRAQDSFIKKYKLTVVENTAPVSKGK